MRGSAYVSPVDIMVLPVNPQRQTYLAQKVAALTHRANHVNDLDVAIAVSGRVRWAIVTRQRLGGARGGDEGRGCRVDVVVGTVEAGSDHLRHRAVHHQKPAGRCVTVMFYMSLAGKLDVCKPNHRQKPTERCVTAMFYLSIAGKLDVCKLTHRQKPTERCVTAMFYLSIAGNLDVCKPNHRQKPTERCVTAMFYLSIAGKQ